MFFQQGHYSEQSQGQDVLKSGDWRASAIKIDWACIICRQVC